MIFFGPKQAVRPTSKGHKTPPEIGENDKFVEN